MDQHKNHTSDTNSEHENSSSTNTRSTTMICVETRSPTGIMITDTDTSVGQYNVSGLPWYALWIIPADDSKKSLF